MKFRSLLRRLLLVFVLASCSGERKSEEAAPETDAKPAAESVDPSSFPEVVATVDGTPITRDDLVARAQAEAAGQGSEHPMTLDFFRSVLDDLINSELLYKESQAKGFAPSEQEVEERVATIRSRFPSAEEFEAALESQGLTEERMTRALRKDLGIGRMLEEEIVSKVEVSEEQSRDFFESNPDKMTRGDEIRVSHILIRVDRGAALEAVEKAEREAEDLRRRLVEGADFAELARKNSEDPGSAPLGGDLSWVARGAMVPSFEQAAYALEKGELSPVVRSPFGFHIIKQTDRRPGKPLTFEEAKEGIAKFLQERAVQEGIGSQVAELRSKAAVEIFIDQ